MQAGREAFVKEVGSRAAKTGVPANEQPARNFEDMGRGMRLFMVRNAGKRGEPCE